MSVSLSDRILRHARCDNFAEQMTRFYAKVDRMIESHGPTCWNRGACCQFGRYGHKLYVTSAELAYFVRGLGGHFRVPSNDTACPYQIQGQCTAREYRPLGCRIFYCDPDAQHWQNDAYERQLKELKSVSEDYGIDYHYCEWLSALGMMRVEPAPEGANRPSSGIDRLPLPVIQ